MDQLSVGYAFTHLSLGLSPVFQCNSWSLNFGRSIAEDLIGSSVCDGLAVLVDRVVQERIEVAGI